MNIRNTYVRLYTVLFTSLFTSVLFAQASAVSDRASLAGDDFIDWQAYYNGNGFTWVTSPLDALTDGGAGVTVEQSAQNMSLILEEPGVFGDSNLPDGSHVYNTGYQEIFPDPVSFHDFDGISVCALGTEITPLEPGPFEARIEATYADNSSEGFSFNGDTGGDPLFIGIESTEPMTRVEVSVLNNGGILVSFYSINQVDLRACTGGVPVLACEGFGAPMDNYPVTTRKNRVFPLKMELFDTDGFEVTGVDLAAPPVVEVMYTGSGGGEAVDVSSDVLAAGQGTDGNQFVYTDDGIWQFNLKSKDHSAAGIYDVTVVSGDESEYRIDPSCVTSFVK